MSETETPTLHKGDALMIIDMQNDFLPGGALAVAKGDQVIPVLNDYIAAFEAKHLSIYASRDWHPANHASFKEQGGPWPPHCVQGSKGAEFTTSLHLPEKIHVVSGGYKPQLAGYSAFEATDLDAELKQQGVKRLFVGGLATDYCVLHTVKEARARGYEVVLIDAAIRAVNIEPDDGAKAIDTMMRLGAHDYTGETPH